MEIPISNEILILFEKYDTTRILNFINESIQGTKYTRSSMYNYILKYNKKEVDKETGYLLEVFQGSLCIGDDLMDNSKIRRNKPAYYLSRGMISLKDSLFLIGLVNKLMNKKCINLFRDILFTTCIGQVLDTKKKKKDEYTKYLYEKICEYKTGAYSVYFPLSCGFIMCNKKIPDYLYDLSIKLGIIFQMTDDFINFYPEKSKKSESDIEEKKLTYFTCLLSKEKDKEIDEYFLENKISSFIRKKIFSYFNFYKIDLKTLINETKTMVLEEDKEELEILYKILDIYLYKNK